MKYLQYLCLSIALAIVSPVLASTSLFTGCNSHINQMLQDCEGFIWIATDNGLTRYDGHNVHTFSRTAGSPSLLNNIVLSIMEDSHGSIWVGTYDGIQRFNRNSETFETPRQSWPGLPEFTYVNSIIEDSAGNIWFTTSRSGLICYRGADERPVSYQTTNSAICSDKTTVVCEDRFGNIWVGSNDSGVSVFNPQNNTIISYAASGNAGSLSGNMIYGLAQGPDGRMYVASVDGGIDAYNYRTKQFDRGAIAVGGKPFALYYDDSTAAMYVGTDGNGIYRYAFDSGSTELLVPDVTDFDVRHAKVHDLMRDRDGNLWAAIYQKGALMIADDSGIANFGFRPFNSRRNIGTAPVLAVMRSNDGDIWIGTDGDGIYRGDGRHDFRHYSGADLSSDIVMCLHQSRKGDVWAGTYLGGLMRCPAGSTQFSKISLTDLGGVALFH